LIGAAWIGFPAFNESSGGVCHGVTFLPGSVSPRARNTVRQNGLKRT
jgi:hypothetical protein